ncbi:MAG: histone-like nucleoid-structuring protein Lsr2 [Actinomycetes bacterium]
MAQRTQVLLIDDLDGGDADETVTFALDGVTYEIDLNESNADKLRDVFAPWVSAARRVGGRAAGRGRAKPRARAAAPASSGNLNPDIRTWARASGYEISDRGRIPGGVIEAYHEANG